MQNYPHTALLLWGQRSSGMKTSRNGQDFTYNERGQKTGTELEQLEKEYKKMCNNGASITRCHCLLSLYDLDP